MNTLFDLAVQGAEFFAIILVCGIGGVMILFMLREMFRLFGMVILGVDILQLWEEKRKGKLTGTILTETQETL